MKLEITGANYNIHFSESIDYIIINGNSGGYTILFNNLIIYKR